MKTAASLFSDHLNPRTPRRWRSIDAPFSEAIILTMIGAWGEATYVCNDPAWHQRWLFGSLLRCRQLRNVVPVAFPISGRLKSCRACLRFFLSERGKNVVSVVIWCTLHGRAARKCRREFLKLYLETTASLFCPRFFSQLQTGKVCAAGFSSDCIEYKWGVKI